MKTQRVKQKEAFRHRKSDQNKLFAKKLLMWLGLFCKWTSIYTLLQERSGKRVQAVHQMGLVTANKNRLMDTFSRVFFVKP